MTDQQPMGHTPPFTGDAETMIHCAKVVVEHARQGHYNCRVLHTHAAQLYGEAAFFLPDQSDNVPVFGAADDCPDTVEECCAKLEAMLPASAEEAKLKAAGPVQWWQIAQLVFQIVQLLGEKK